MYPTSRTLVRIFSPNPGGVVSNYQLRGSSTSIRRFNHPWQSSSTYKSLLGGDSKHCSQNRAFLDGRSRRAEADRVRGSPPEFPMLPPAPSDGELMPAPHLFRPLPDPEKSIKPPLESDIVRLRSSSLRVVLENDLQSLNAFQVLWESFQTIIWNPHFWVYSHSEYMCKFT